MDHNRADGHATDSASRGGPAGAPADQAAVHRANLALALRHVSANGPCSRSAVAVATGLNKATVTSLVTELQARGLVKEMGPQHAGSVGRPGVALALDGSLGVEVNVDYIAAIASTFRPPDRCSAPPLHIPRAAATAHAVRRTDAAVSLPHRAFPVPLLPRNVPPA